MAWATASTLLKVVFVLMIIAVILDLIGFATPYWIAYEGLVTAYNNRLYYGYINWGLWRYCQETRGGSTHCSSMVSNASWFEATQAFETLGFIAAVVALILIVLYIFVPQTSGKRIIFILGMIACFAAAGCIILGIIIYGSKVKDNLSWSFALCTIAGIIFGISGILLIIDMLKR